MMNMQDALVQEHILSQITSANVESSRKGFSGWINAHFEALRYVTYALHSTRFQNELDATEMQALIFRYGMHSIPVFVSKIERLHLGYSDPDRIILRSLPFSNKNKDHPG